MKSNILEEIKSKREFSQLPDIDVELAYKQFEKRQASDEEKIKLTKELLRKIFSAFVSKKLLSLKEKEPEWILRKHISTNERLPYYEKLYKRIFGDCKKASVVDLGAGINGFSYEFFRKIKVNVNYTAIESVGQLTKLMNFYFEKNKLRAKAINLSLFELEKVRKIINEQEKPRFIFLFKTIDALESLERDYSKKLILETAPLVDKYIVSFPTSSLGGKEKFKANRKWIVDFIQENFKILDNFEMGNEKYIVLEVLNKKFK